MGMPGAARGRLRGLPAVARRRLPGPAVALLTPWYRRVCRWSNRMAVALVWPAVSALPDGAKVALRQRLSLVRRMDYDAAEVLLSVTSEVERTTRLWSCTKEPETVSWLEGSFAAGDVLYDVGANVGAYSLLAHRLAAEGARIYAFEPSYRSFASLADNVHLNDGDGAVTVLPLALTGTTGMTTFHYAGLAAGEASHPGVRRVHGAAVERSQPVLGAALDDVVALFGLAPPTHLKIDVDGSETEVLDGARETLRARGLRSLMIEVDTDRSDLAGVERRLHDAGLRLAADYPHDDETTHNRLYVRP